MTSTHPRGAFELRVQHAIDYPPRAGSKAEIRDESTPGLVVRVSSSGKASYYAELYDRISKKRTYEKLGDFGVIKLAKARAVAAQRRERVQHQAADGISYVEQKNARRAQELVDDKRSSTTLKSCIDAYINAKHLAAASVSEYRGTLESKLNSFDILERPVSEITKSWFDGRFKEIYARSKSTGWRWWAYLHAVLKHAAERDPNLFPDGLPVPEKKALRGFEKPGRKSSRLDLTQLPALRARLLELDPDDRDYVLLLLLTGMRSGAVMRLRYVMSCSRADALAWSEGRALIFDATEARAPRELVVSEQVRGLISDRYARLSNTSDYLFWSKRKPADTNKAMQDDRDVFKRLGFYANDKTLLTAHDLRRTFAYIARAVLGIDPLLIAKLQLHSTKNLSVSDGYVSATNADLRRVTNRISGEILRWMRSTEEEIAKELGVGSNASSPAPSFAL
ncbi:tyrosine-type recombinase/integrase [Niveibacterium sp. 24ML]|uniref:tyrosine-type recombinase/integrase n=1 Tax=Niveibacterium sp. 24ML TaxID=2985512 RepID=UPI00226D8C9E|nr:integrase family protein [Niveibacterium sp. 24ML]MCX9156476.1 tyrosine-type recombinase/integrase [Niveibacterium sp. 24ML]